MAITFSSNYYYIIIRQDPKLFNRNFMEMVLQGNSQLGSLFKPDPRGLSGIKESITIVYPAGDHDLDSIGTTAGFKTQQASMKQIWEVLKDNDCAKLICFWEGSNFNKIQFDDRQFDDSEIESSENMQKLVESAKETLGQDSVHEFYIANKKKSWDWLQRFWNEKQEFPTEDYLVKEQNKYYERFRALETAIDQNDFDQVMSEEEGIEMDKATAISERNYFAKRTELFGNCLDQLGKFIETQTKYNENRRADRAYPVKITKYPKKTKKSKQKEVVLG
jgi:hypothetical protein